MDTQDYVQPYTHLWPSSCNQTVDLKTFNKTDLVVQLLFIRQSVMTPSQLRCDEVL